MMQQQQAGAPAEKAPAKELLHAIYTVYSHWVARFPLACCVGCGTCCTQSVTMTSLEGEVILDFVKRTGRERWLLEKLAGAGPGKSRPAITINRFAAACLSQEEVAGETPGNWDFTPCVFLEEQQCAIYAVRPFGCRSFGSFVQCSADRAAEMAPIHLAVNTVFTQIIEHVNSPGGCCATLNDILHSLVDSGSRPETMHLLEAQPVPGFLLEPHEIKVVKALLQELSGQFSERVLFGDLIDNFMPI